MMDAALSIEANMAAQQKRNLTTVIKEYSKRLLGFIKQKVANESDAEDILQDVFFQLANNTQPIEQMTAWLFRVARNRIIDVKRKNKPELLDDLYPTDSEEDEMLGWINLFTDLTDTPENSFLRNLFWETLYSALEELPKDQKRTFVMNELEGISFKDIAAETGVSVNTLLSQKRYAVLHLRDRLKVLHNELLNN